MYETNAFLTFLFIGKLKKLPEKKRNTENKSRAHFPVSPLFPGVNKAKHFAFSCTMSVKRSSTVKGGGSGGKNAIVGDYGMTCDENLTRELLWDGLG